MTNLRTLSKTLASCALAAGLLLGALPAAAQADFTKIVAVGASVDSGFLDSCWVKHGQLDAWPAIFARQAGRDDFQQPLINEPGLGGCQVLTSLAPTFSAKPSTGTPANLTLQRPYDNLAIPGYLAASVTTCKTAGAAAPCANPLIDLVLRGSGATVLEQAASLHPTFAIVGVLGNELLGPATSGTVIDNVTLMPAALYGASYKTIVDTLKASQSGTGKGIVATIPDVTSLPYFTTVSPILGVNPATGAPIYALGATGCPSGVPVCPVPAGTLVPLPLGALMKSGYGVPCAVAPLPNCNKPLPDNADPVTRIPGILYPSEVALLQSRGAAYNEQIRTLATADGYKVFDTAALLADIKAHGREIAGITFTSAYLTGGIFSYDGVHPTAMGYAIVADAAIQFVNASYGTNLQRPNMYPYLFDGNSSGGIPAGRPSYDELLDWAAAYFTPEVLAQFGELFPLVGPSLALPGGDDQIPVRQGPGHSARD